MNSCNSLWLFKCACDLKTRKLREWNKESPFKENIEGVFAQKERAEEGELKEFDF